MIQELEGNIINCGSVVRLTFLFLFSFVFMENIWSDIETKLLITLWGDANVQSQLENHSIRNNAVFEKLAKGMSDSGFERNNKQCQSKIKHLREKYRNYMDKIARSGAGSSRPPKFFDEMNEVLGKVHKCFFLHPQMFYPHAGGPLLARNFLI